MTSTHDLEEQLREAACFGNEDAVKLLVAQGVNINAQHSLNGWSALHWSAKRGHTAITAFLLEHGADVGVKTEKGETPGQLATSSDTRAVLGLGVINTDGHPSSGLENLPIIPNYISNPPFPYGEPKRPSSHGQPPVPAQKVPMQSPVTAILDPNEVVLKVRVANAAEQDFIEIEMSQKEATFDNLISTMCHELNVDRALVHKVRKLPNTIVRKDKDVMRLVNFQELELVLTNRAASESSRNYSGGPSVIPKHVDVVY